MNSRVLVEIVVVISRPSDFGIKNLGSSQTL